MFKNKQDINSILPPELIVKILKNLGYIELQELKFTCRLWNEIATLIRKSKFFPSKSLLIHIIHSQIFLLS